MKTFEMRIYSLKSEEAAKAYRAIWIKHIESLKHLGIVTHGVFTAADNPTKIVALVNYPEDGSPQALTEQYMNSEAFKADMEGFDMTSIASVDAVPLKPESFSPLR